MTVSVHLPSPKNMVCVIPQQVIFLGEALAPVAKNARLALARQVLPSGQEFATLQDVPRHMGVIQQALSHLTHRLDSLMTDVIHLEDAGAIEAGRAAGRLEQVLSEFVDGHHDAMASHADVDAEASEARVLILGVYRHHIKEICEWLEELVRVITDPASAIQKRGMAAAANIELTVALNLTSPPEMARLEALATSLLQPQEVRREPLSSIDWLEQPAPGLLGTLGALAFGVGVAEAVFGRKHG